MRFRQPSLPRFVLSNGCDQKAACSQCVEFLSPCNFCQDVKDRCTLTGSAGSPLFCMPGPLEFRWFAADNFRDCTNVHLVPLRGSSGSAVVRGYELSPATRRRISGREMDIISSTCSFIRMMLPLVFLVGHNHEKNHQTNGRTTEEP